MADKARENSQPHPDTGSIAVLTVAHLGVPKPDGTPGDKHDKTDVRDENLAALCPRCHIIPTAAGGSLLPTALINHHFTTLKVCNQISQGPCESLTEIT